ncbi:MAG: cysteine desulfurase [Lachnospiraceae bacterium]|nr:cysteine desulfurase [Lachnospiraceae bacterium]
MECYLDNSATTRCSERAAETVNKVLLSDYGNPSSLHNKGMEAENYIKEARSAVAKSLKCKENCICFTSGGSESNNLAIFGSLFANKRLGKHIITTEVEHAAVYSPMKKLQEMGYEVSFLKVDPWGKIDLVELESLIREDTALVSIMHVNNEIGTIEPIEEAAKLVHKLNPNTIFHCDAIQSYGKLPLYPGRIGVDLMSVSGHKIHAPKGSGFLYIKEGLKMEPLIYGGGHENGLRSGTENVPAIAGLSCAVEEMFKEDHTKKLCKLKAEFIKRIIETEGISVNGVKAEIINEIKGSDPVDEKLIDKLIEEKEDFGAFHIVSVSAEGVRAEVLLHALEEEGVYCSAGSACSSNRPAISRTLLAIGLDEKLLDSTVRFSFSIYTTVDEILYACEKINEIIPRLNKYTRK